MIDMTVTEAAAQRIRQQLDKRGHGLGLRLSVKETGCSGYSYVMDYADEQHDGDLVVEAHGARVYVDPDSAPLLKGLHLDFRRDGLNQLFHFDNPNATELCGCGESFTTAAEEA